MGAALGLVQGADIGPATQNTGAAFLVGSLSVIAAILALLGVSGGLTGRMIRNEQTLTIVAFIATALAVSAGVIAGLLKSNADWQAAVLGIGIGLFMTAAIFTILAAAKVWGDRPAPNVGVSVTSTKRGDLLRLAVKDSGLKSSERLTLKVWPVEGTSYTEEVTGEEPSVGSISYATGALPLYEDVLGPDAEGNVEASPHALLPLGHAPQVVVDASAGDTSLKDCEEKEGEAGCVILNLGNSSPPQLRMNWSVRHRRPILRMAVDARELGPNSLHTLVVGIRPGLTRRLVGGVLAPGPAGSIKQRLEVPVLPSFGQVCAVISPTPVATCPPAGATMPGADLKACVEAREKIEKQAEKQASPVKFEASCKREYAKSILEGTTWQRVRTPG